MRNLLIIGLISTSTWSYADYRANTRSGSSEAQKNSGVNGATTSVPPEWAPYLDPTTTDFWREGNHIPDGGFLLLLKNPTLENAKRYLLRMETKAKYAEKIMQLVLKAQEDLVTSGQMKDRYSMVHSSNDSLKKIYEENLKTLQFFFLFKPGCGACARAAESLRQFPNVAPLQVIPGKLHQWAGLPASGMASEETKASYLKSGTVPVIVILDSKSAKVTVIEGVTGAKDIMDQATHLIAERAKS